MSSLSPTTVELIRAALKADPKITPAQRNEHLALLRHGGNSQPTGAKPLPRIVRRKEAAQRLGRSLRTVDLLCVQGLLKRVRFKGRKHAGGITAESLDALIASEE